MFYRFLFQNETQSAESIRFTTTTTTHALATSLPLRFVPAVVPCRSAILPVRRQTLEVSMGLLIKSATAAVLVVTTLLFGGNASAAPLGASLALRDALTPTAQFVQWGGGYDDSGGYGDVGYGGEYGGYAGCHGGYG